MKKKLISADNISKLLGSNDSEFHVDNSMILTSGAKDYLRNKKVKLVYGSKKGGQNEPGRPGCSSAEKGNLRKVVEKIVSILRNELQIHDAAKVERVTQLVLKKLSNS